MARIDTVQHYRGSGSPGALPAGAIAWDTTNKVMYAGTVPSIVGQQIPGTSGHIFINGSDEDITLWSLPNVTGTPLVIWDESEDSFNFNKNVKTTGVDAGASTFGDGTNEAQISGAGVVTLAGTAKRVLTLRPEANVEEIRKVLKPDQVQVGAGAFFGYSMPIYAADNEEIYLRESVPGRWDGASNVTFHVLCCLAVAETADEEFQFQASWNHVAEGDVVPTTVTDTLSGDIVVVDGTQYAAYEMSFTFVYGDMAAHDLLSVRLRRVAITDGDEVDGEIIVLDWHTHYQTDKMFTAS